MEKSSFFNSVNRDRKYKAEEFASYFGSFISNGIFPNPSTNLQIISNNNMTITLKAGKGWINGYYYENTDDKIFNIDVADGVLNRIDRVVLRLDYLNREIKTVVKKGVFSSSPIVPILQRDADRFELALADIKVNKGAISILQSNIVDTRLSLELCGVTNSLITVDVGIITNQFSEDFNEWFERIKGQLGEDAAGNLQNQVDLLEQNKVSNEVFDLHLNNKSNPHVVTKSQVGLPLVENFGVATKAEAETGTGNAKYMTPLRVKESILKNTKFAIEETLIEPGEYYVPKSATGYGEINTTQYKEIWRVPVSLGGTYRVKFHFWTYPDTRNPKTIYGRIYVNSSARGFERSYYFGPDDKSPTYTEDITVNKGDLIQIFCKSSNSLRGNVLLEGLSVKDFYQSNLAEVIPPVRMI